MFLKSSWQTKGQREPVGCMHSSQQLEAPSGWNGTPEPTSSCSTEYTQPAGNEVLSSVSSWDDPPGLVSSWLLSGKCCCNDCAGWKLVRTIPIISKITSRRRNALASLGDGGLKGIRKAVFDQLKQKEEWEASSGASKVGSGDVV